VYWPLEESKRVGAEEINDPSEYVKEIEKDFGTMGLEIKKDDADDGLAGMMKDVGIKKELLGNSGRTTRE